MRLVCPKCVAQYEVAEQEIPEEGREVQCANCGNIWFQDRIVMFTEKRETADTTDESPQTDDPELFEDLDGVGEVAFQRHRDEIADPAADPSEPVKSGTPDDDFENILADDAEEFDEEPEYEDDPPMDAPEGGRPLTDDVLDVLRKEAEFSSNRAGAVEDEETAPPPVSSDAPTENEEHVLEEPLETDLDELTAFLSSYEADNTEPAPEEEETPEVAEEPQEQSDSQAPVFDPLSDLEAIRSQLDSIGNDPEDAVQEDDPLEASYTPVLPEDDTLSDEDFTPDIEIPDLEMATAAAQAAQEPEESVTDTPAGFDPEAFALDLDSSETETDLSDAIPFDDFEEPRPRRAFRADMATDDPVEVGSSDETFFAQTDDSTQPAQEPAADDDTSAIPAALALGAKRPRTSGSTRRIRKIAEPEDLIGATPPASEPARDPAEALSRPVRPAKSTSSERPERPRKASKKQATSRKELLPDVEELDSTLRGEGPTLQAEQDIPDTDAAPAGKSFGRAFVWTLLILAILVALYVMRPMIVAILPASGVVLNPYGNFIDSMRLMIESLIG